MCACWQGGQDDALGEEETSVDRLRRPRRTAHASRHRIVLRVSCWLDRCRRVAFRHGQPPVRPCLPVAHAGVVRAQDGGTIRHHPVTPKEIDGERQRAARGRGIQWSPLARLVGRSLVGVRCPTRRSRSWRWLRLRRRLATGLVDQRRKGGRRRARQDDTDTRRRRARHRVRAVGRHWPLASWPQRRGLLTAHLRADQLGREGGGGGGTRAAGTRSQHARFHPSAFRNERMKTRFGAV